MDGVVTETQWRRDVLLSPMFAYESDERYPWHFTLGRVRARQDGRWDWWRKPLTGEMGRVDERWKVVREEQGVADTIEAAKKAVERGLGEPRRCNRKICGAPLAIYYNPSTEAFYCQKCSKKINEHNPGLCVLRG